MFEFTGMVCPFSLINRLPTNAEIAGDLITKKNISKTENKTHDHKSGTVFLFQRKYQAAQAVIRKKMIETTDGGRDAVIIPAGLKYRVIPIKRIIPAITNKVLRLIFFRRACGVAVIAQAMAMMINVSDGSQKSKYLIRLRG